MPALLSACLALALFALLAGQAYGQTATTLVSNLSKTPLTANVDEFRAQSFTTGTNTKGYELTEVRIRMKTTSGKTTSVTIREDDSGEPDDLLATLSNPSSLTQNGVNTFTVPTGTTVTLAAETTYWVSVNEGISSGMAGYAVTVSDGESGESGWSIGDQCLWRNSEGNSWGTTNSSLMIAVKGVVTNAAPTVANAIPDQTATPGTPFGYTFPANTFSDPDSGDTLSYTATKGDGSMLPNWLEFDADTRTFSGTPGATDVGTVTVRVTATDGSDESVSDEFKITVRSTVVLTVRMLDDEITEGEPVRYRIEMSRRTGWVSVGMQYRYRGQFMRTTPSSSLGGMRSRKRRLYWEVERDTVDDGKVEPDGTFTVELQPGDGYTLGSPSTATVRILDNDGGAVPTGAEVSVADARVEEGPGAELAFPVTLDRALGTTVTVDWETLEGVGSRGARAGRDFEAGSGTLTFHPGQTAKTVRIKVLDDTHDEGPETMLLLLSNASGADLDDNGGSLAVGTIENTDMMPKAWLARFGRTVAEQVVEAAENRLRAGRSGGADVRIAGYAIGTASAHDEAAKANLEALARWNADAPGTGGGAEPEADTITAAELVAGTAFSLGAGGTGPGAGTAALWGRGVLSGFDGREGELTLDGEIASAMFGADVAHGRWSAGAMLAHSRGEGAYQGADGGEVESELTGLYPYGRYALDERVTLWGVAGYGAGTLGLTPEGQETIDTDIDLVLGAIGLRGVVREASGEGGPEVALTTDALGVRTTSAEVRGASGRESLAATETRVTRLRLGVESLWQDLALGAGKLSPRLEAALRHDGGDAETGFGLDIGAGFGWTDEARGLSAEVSTRALLAHDAGGFAEHGLAASIAYDSRPKSERGLELTLRQSVGAQAAGGVDALLGRETLAGLAANDDGDDELARQRLELRLGYGLPAFGDRFTATPELGFGLSESARDYRVGWRLGFSRSGSASVELKLEATRREAANDEAPEHGVGLSLGARW